ELPGLIKGSDPAKVRAAIELLVSRLALVEDLDGKTLEVVVGLLPDVREGIARAGARRTRPPLVVVDPPAELGPEGSPLIDDLRSLLLEVAAEPPRLRQNGGLFSKEVGRFEQALVPLPPWLDRELEV